MENKNIRWIQRWSFKDGDIFKTSSSEKHVIIPLHSTSGEKYIKKGFSICKINFRTYCCNNRMPSYLTIYTVYLVNLLTAVGKRVIEKLTNYTDLLNKNANVWVWDFSDLLKTNYKEQVHLFKSGKQIIKRLYWTSLIKYCSI